MLRSLTAGLTITECDIKLQTLLFISLIVQSDKCLNSLSCSAFIFLQLSCKIIAMIIKHPYNTLYIQSVLQSFILQSTSFCKSSFIVSYVSLRTMFYMIRLTGDISILEAKVALYSICIPVIYLCPLTFVQPKHVVFVLSGARRILEYTERGALSRRHGESLWSPMHRSKACYHLGHLGISICPLAPLC